MGSVAHTIREADPQSVRSARRGRWLRRCGVAAMGLFVAAGAFGVLGYRQGSVVAETGAYRMEVSYPRITRAGLASNWEVRVDRLDGGTLPDSFALRSGAGYFTILDQNALSPEPASTWSDAATVTWLFEPGEAGASTLVVSIDARLQPNARGWFDGRTELVIDDVTVLAVDFRTWAVP